MIGENKQDKDICDLCYCKSHCYWIKKNVLKSNFCNHAKHRSNKNDK